MQKINTQNITQNRVILLPVFHSFKHASAHVFLFTFDLNPTVGKSKTAFNNATEPRVSSENFGVALTDS